MFSKQISSSKFLHYAIAILGVALVSIALRPFQETLSSTTVALAFLLVVLFVATFIGRNPALVSSFLAMLCFNYYFLPPIHTLTISTEQNLVAWGAFTLTAIIAGELSAYARRRARDSERLYLELEEAFEQASHSKALEQSEKLKSALLDAVTHDLRTPLTSIKASITMLLEENTGESVHITMDRNSRRELLEVIDEETDRLNHFVESMVEVAKLDAGEFKLRKLNTNFGEIVENVSQRTAKITAQHRVKLLIDEDLPPINVDSKTVSEALYNLIDNAAKYSPHGSQITIAAKRSGESIEISVEDQGKGILEFEREKIFEKFYRGSSKIKGFGMGLAIVRGIIEAHGGVVSVMGDARRGARFVITLPIKGDK